MALYQRIFGEGFQDPNAKTFTPDTQTMVKKSVLSTVAEDRQRVMRMVGADDRRRLDEYFTSIRQLEEQLALQLQPPAPVENFIEAHGSADKEVEFRDHERHGDAQDDGGPARRGAAMRPDQGRQRAVFGYDVEFAPRGRGRQPSRADAWRAGQSNSSGYQEQVGWFATQSMVAWKEMLDALAEIPEGKGTLLDNCLVLAHSDCSIANTHAVEGIPMMVAGNAGGRVRTGFHLAGARRREYADGPDAPAGDGRAGREMGSKTMETNRTITELIAVSRELVSIAIAWPRPACGPASVG